MGDRSLTGRDLLDCIPRRELVNLVAYLETGSHKAAAHRLGISESTSRHRIAALLRRLGVNHAMQAVWLLHDQLVVEGCEVPRHIRAAGDAPCRGPLPRARPRR